MVKVVLGDDFWKQVVGRKKSKILTENVFDWKTIHVDGLLENELKKGESYVKKSSKNNKT